MRATINSFGGHNINDGTNYRAYFPKGTFFQQAPGQSVELARSDAPPVISTVTRQSKILTIAIVPLGVFTTQINTLNGWFDTFGKNLQRLIVTDENAVQWFVKGRVDTEPAADVEEVRFTLRVPDPCWQLVTPATDIWNITGTAQTRTITTVGNRSVYPILAISPTSAKVGSSKQHEYRVWYNPQTTAALKDEAIDIVNNAWNTAALVSDTTVSNQINQGGGIGTGLTPFPIDTAVGGGLVSAGMCKVDNEYIIYTISGSTFTPVQRGAAGSTAATHADNAVMTQSRTFPDGRDLRVRLLGDGAGTLIPYWLQDYNTTTTQVWTVVDFDPGITLTLGTATNNSSAVTTLEFERTATNLVMLQRLAKKSTFIFLIGTEVFTFNNPAATGDTTQGTNGVTVDIANYKITSTATDTRGKYNSTKASHAVGVNVYWIQYVFQLAYGNTSAVAQTQDETQKPIFDLSSTYSTYSWGTNFSDAARTRTGGWSNLVRNSPGKKSKCYNKKHTLGADTSPVAQYVDPSTGMGLWLSAFQQSTTWRGEAGLLEFSWYNAAGFTTFTLVDALYRYSSDWPAFVGLQVSVDGVKWQNCTGFPEASPAGSKSWTAGAAHTSVALGGTFYYVRWVIDGSIAGNIPNNVIAAEVTSLSLVRDSSKIMQLGYTSAAQTSTYRYFGKITNNGTGDFIVIDFVLAINDTLTIDCLNKHVTHTDYGGHAHGSISFSSKRNYWLTIEPPSPIGVTNGGQLQFDEMETGATTGNNTITTTYYDRLA
jgi:hypothetical protein